MEMIFQFSHRTTPTETAFNRTMNTEQCSQTSRCVKRSICYTTGFPDSEPTAPGVQRTKTIEKIINEFNLARTAVPFSTLSIAG